MALSRIGWSAAALLLAACPGPAGDGNPDGGALRIELGGVDEGGRFQPLPPALVGERGQQGGIHVGVGLRMPEGGTGDLLFSLKVSRASDGALISETTREFNVGFAEPGWTSGEPLRVFMCPPRSPVPIVGTPLTFEVTATGRRTPGVLGRTVSTATFQCPLAYPSCDSACR